MFLIFDRKSSLSFFLTPSPSSTAWETIPILLSNLLWGNTLIAVGFLWFSVLSYKDFRIITAAREKSKPAPLDAKPFASGTI